MIYNIITRYKISKFAIYFASINTVIYFPFVIGLMLDFIESDISGLGGFIGFAFFSNFNSYIPFSFHVFIIREKSQSAVNFIYRVA